MTLKEELSALRQRLEAGRKPEVVAKMHRAVDELRQSGAADRILKVGAKAPDFVLPQAEEKPVALKEVLARGPAIVTFYRGRW